MFQDGDVLVGVSPELEKILVGRLCLRLISRQNERSAQLQVGECTDRIANHDPAVIENLLEFRGSFGAPVRGQVGLAAHINRIQRSEVAVYGAARSAKLIQGGDLQQVDSLQGLAIV